MVRSGRDLVLGTAWPGGSPACRMQNSAEANENLLERLEHYAAVVRTQSELGVGPEEAASPDGPRSVQSLLGYSLIHAGHEEAVGAVSLEALGTCNPFIQSLNCLSDKCHI